MIDASLLNHPTSSTEHPASRLTESLKEKFLFIGLDRDGTLVPIHANPNLAIVPAELSTLLSRLASAAGVVVSVISARSGKQLAKDFESNQLILAGNYGMEIRFADGTTVINQTAETARESLQEVKATLKQRLSIDIPLILEDHGLSLCLHYHLLEPRQRPLVHNVVAELQQDFRQLRFRSLPTSYEVLPELDWDKSKALSIITGKLNKSNDDWFYIFIGDSEADEPAFHWVNKRNGLSIRVGHSKQTRALFEIDSPARVVEFLHSIAAGRTGSGPGSK